MKKLFLILFIISCAGVTKSQNFAFEEPDAPAEWLVDSKGELSISTDHYKEGAQSLCWSTTGISVLNISFTNFIAGNVNSAFMQIYSTAITNDILIVEFLNNTVVKKKAQFLCNFKGWREFNRAYTEYASTLSTSITSVRITLKPTTSGTRKIYFDKVDFNYPTESARLIGSQWVLDKDFFPSNNSSLELYANPVDIDATTPSSQELADLNALRITLKRTPAAGNSTNLAAAKAYVNSLNITRNADNSVCGKIINTSAPALTTAFMSDISNKMEILAAASLTDVTTKVLFQNFVDHLLDQGIAEGCNFRLISSDYTASRTIPAKLLNAIPACTATQKDEIVKLVRWISFYGMLYYPQDSYKSNLVSDVLYLFLPHMMAVALNQSDDASAVRELKAFKRYLERNTEYVPGGGDVMKPDGTGFHHNTHYNNYMYAYLTWTEYISYLKGTQFKISVDAYQRYKKAIIAIYTMATLDGGDARHYPNSLAGRNPFESGIGVYFTKNLFDKLISVGADCLGTNTDEELAAAYNYFFQTTKYNVPAKNYEGFYQYNYSPLGIYRKGNWVASMRAPTTNFWGAEIYNNANRFGRYQSHGTLEITYAGTPGNSGYPTNGTGGGWDWNVIPGTTTVHYTSWQEMMPYKSEVGRFDQKTKTKNFSGALSWGDCGMFACDFDQVDTWSSSAFTATNLTFKKSMFAFDNLIISLGSGIGSYGNYSNTMTTATNLFQNIISASSGDLVLNGMIKAKPYNSTISTTQDNWFITPQGTGYFIPQGNDPIVLNFDNQSSPGENGADYAAPLITSSAAKAYLNHGVKPAGKNYCFVVVPATDATQMQTLATQMVNGGGSTYQINAQTSLVHSLTYKPLNITAYSFFGAVSNMSFGIVKSTTAEHLLMDKKDSEANRHYFAISNPNLHPQTDATYGWVATANQTTLTLAGEWRAITPVEGVIFSNPSNGETQVTITMNNGAPVYFGIKDFSDTAGIDVLKKNDWVVFSKEQGNLKLVFPKISMEKVRVQICSTNGLMLYQQNTNCLNQTIQIPTCKFQPGVFLCTVSDSQHTKTFKWIN